MGITPSDIVKSLVVKRSDDTYVFALVPGGRKISWPKLRALLSVNKLQLPDASHALAATGYERGTITPLGSTTAWPVVRRRERRRTTCVDGRRRTRTQPLRRRRLAHRRVRGDGRRHHRPRVASTLPRQGCSRRRPRTPSPRRRRRASRTGSVPGIRGRRPGALAHAAFSSATCVIARAKTSLGCAPETPYLPSMTKKGTPLMP